MKKLTLLFPFFIAISCTQPVYAYDKKGLLKGALKLTWVAFNGVVIYKVWERMIDLTISESSCYQLCREDPLMRGVIIVLMPVVLQNSFGAILNEFREWQISDNFKKVVASIQQKKKDDQKVVTPS